MRERIDRGGVMLLIDALDEVPVDTATPGTPVPRKRLDDRLRHWAASSPGAARFVLTTRLAGYSGPPVPQAHEIELLPFTADDARAAIQAWDLAGPAAARVSGLLAVPALAALTRIPLLLALVRSLAADPPDQQVLPETRAGLYEAVVWQFLSGAHRSADPGARAPAIRPADRQSLLRVLTRIAMTFAVTDRGWIDRMPYPEIAAAIRGAQDAADDGPASAVLNRLADEIGILVPAGNPAVREQPYLFLHRTIAEYLVARHLRDLPQPERMSIVESHQWFDPDWAEVIPMLGGLLAIEHSSQARALVAHFLGQRPDPLHRAFHAALRVLGETPDPDQLLTSAQADELGQRTRGLLAARTTWATRERLIRVLLAAPAWPHAVTDALLDSIGRDGLKTGRAAVSPIMVTLNRGVAESLRVRLTEQGQWLRLEMDEENPTEALLTRLADDDRSVRRKAVHALAGRVDAGVTEALIGCLADRDQQVRDDAIEALASRPGIGVTEALIGCFAADYWSVRRAAARAMTNRDDMGVTEALLGCLSDERSDVRAAALRALACRQHAGLTEALLGCVTDGDWEVRQAAVRALAGRVDVGVTEALIGRLADPLGQVAEAAMDGLAACATRA